MIGRVGTQVVGLADVVAFDSRGPVRHGVAATLDVDDLFGGAV